MKHFNIQGTTCYLIGITFLSLNILYIITDFQKYDNFEASDVGVQYFFSSYDQERC